MAMVYQRRGHSEVASSSQEIVSPMVRAGLHMLSGLQSGPKYKPALKALFTFPNPTY